jgi:CRP-like cAMP-binding protein
MNKREALSKVALFSKLDDRQLEKLADLSVPKHFPKDTVIIKEGSVGLGMYIITSGKVEIYKGSGDTRTTLAVLEGGTIVGEMALMNDHYRSATVWALEPTECLLVTRDAFQTAIRDVPEVALSVMAVLADRERANTIKLEALRNKVSETVDKVRETTAEEWGTADAASPWEDHEQVPHRRARSGERSTLNQLREAQDVLLRANAEWMGTWMGLMGTFLGGMARMTDASVKSMRSNMMEGIQTAPRRFFESYTGAIDEGLKAYEEVISGDLPHETRRTREEAPVG